MIEAEDQLALPEDRCLFGVEVLRSASLLCLLAGFAGPVNAAAAEADDLSHLVVDRKHDPVAERVVEEAVLRVLGQAGLHDLLLGEARAHQLLNQHVPAARATRRGRVADPPLLLNLRGICLPSMPTAGSPSCR